MSTIGSLRTTARSLLKEAGIISYMIDVDALLMHVLNIDKNTLLTGLRRPVIDNHIDKFMCLVETRCSHMPIQQLTGKCEFMSLEFAVDHNVLVPRPDTEILVEAILKAEKIEDTKGLEIGVGSGCISISLEYYSKDIEMYGVDISPEAVKIANKNHNSIQCSDRKDIFIISDLFKNVPRGTFFDFVVSNPPYIETDEIELLDSCVKDFEPRDALDGGKDGLKFYREIVEQAKDYLKKDGRIYFEIGYNQAQAVKDILATAGYVDIKVLNDYAGKDRVVLARRI